MLVVTEQMKPRNKIHHKLISNGLWLIFTLLVFTALVKLSLWQHGRGLEKQHRLTRITQLNQQSPLTLKQIVSLSNSEKRAKSSEVSHAENINDYPVTMSGVFDPEKIFLLDNQVEKNSLGYRVFQLVHSDGYSVLVNLGWTQGSINRQELPQFTPMTGTHKFTGHIRLVESGIMLMEQNLIDVSWPLRVQQIEIEKFTKLIDEPLLPFVIYVNENEALGYKKNWHAIVMPPEKHQAYAVQWAGLALAWLVLMIWFNFFAGENKQKSLNNNKKNRSNKETPDE